MKQETTSGRFQEIIFTATTSNQRVKLDVIPLRYIDVTKATSTTLDVMLERRIDDYWNFEGDRDLSDAWGGFHTIQGDLVRNVITSRNEDLLNVDHLQHGNWVVYFKT